MRPDDAIQSIFGIPDIKIRWDPSVLCRESQNSEKPSNYLDLFHLKKVPQGKITVLMLFLFTGKYDKLAILVYDIDIGKTAFLHPGKLHREFLVLIKRVPPV
jgi:hypothetical protein